MSVKVTAERAKDNDVLICVSKSTTLDKWEYISDL
jgi:hypothetical protein